MKKNIISIIFSIIVANSIVIGVIGQTLSNSDLQNRIEKHYQKLHSSDFKERYDALSFFNGLKREELNEKVFKASSELLKIEIERIKRVNDFFDKGGIADNLPKDIAYINSEAYGKYHGYLCGLVGKSRDVNLLPLLAQYCLRKEVFINFGDIGVDPVITVLKTSHNPDRKMSAIFVLEEMLKPKDTGYVARGEIRNRIKGALIQATKDSHQYVRSVSLEALGESQDKDVIPILENIAKKDPYSVVEEDPSGKKVKRYPVREDAVKALQKLKAKESEKK